MYQRDATKVQQFAQSSPYKMGLVITMVSLSIQQNWLSVGEQMASVVAQGARSRFLWGSKGKLYAYLEDNMEQIYADTMDILVSDRLDDDKAEALMQVFLRIDGLGLPKAGFCCQLIGGLVGCMDIHNIRRSGLDSKTLALAKNPKGDKAKATNLRKIRDYIRVCHEYGTEELWNDWCDHLATKSKRWDNGSHVSEVHYSYLLH